MRGLGLLFVLIIFMFKVQNFTMKITEFLKDLSIVQLKLLRDGFRESPIRQTMFISTKEDGLRTFYVQGFQNILFRRFKRKLQYCTNLSKPYENSDKY